MNLGLGECEAFTLYKHQAVCSYHSNYNKMHLLYVVEQIQNVEEESGQCNITAYSCDAVFILL